MELVYALIDLTGGGARAWSSSRGEIDLEGRPWRGVFASGEMAACEPVARAMIHLLGDSSRVSDEEREAIMESARRAGYGSVRIETGEPMSPEEAFELLALPFT